MEGLEPPHLTASDPKSDVSTNFTTSGYKNYPVQFRGCKGRGKDTHYENPARLIVYADFTLLPPVP